jgi:hypothetical protein
MKKILKISDTEKKMILEMYGLKTESQTLNEQYAELENLIIRSFVKDLEKTDIKTFESLSKKLGRREGETLAGAFDRILTKAVETHGKDGGAAIMSFCRELTRVNDKFASEFYKTQKPVINQLKKQYPNDWEKLVDTNYGPKIKNLYKAEMVGGSSAASSAEKQLKQIKFEMNIKNAITSGKFNSMSKQQFDKEFVLVKQNLNSTSDLFNNTNSLDDAFSAIFSKHAQPQQIQEILDIMSYKIGMDKENKELFDYLLAKMQATSTYQSGKYNTPWMNDAASLGKDALKGAVNIATPIVEKAWGATLKTLKITAISIGVILFLTIIMIMRSCSSGPSGSSRTPYPED